MKMTILIKSNIGVLLLLFSLCFFIHVVSATVDHPLQSQRHCDRILKLPGQPDSPSFKQYGGYVTIDEKVGMALFYYFVEAADPSFKDSVPLFLWLNGGPGCSSLGYGAMSEIGPYRVKSDGRTLYRNKYSWNKAADSYSFLLKWLEIFPEFKNRDFFIVGESYGGHYAPQLALTILQNKSGNQSNNIINLKGIALGNPLLEEEVQDSGFFNYLWSHRVISDQWLQTVRFNCDFSKPYGSRGKECDKLTNSTRIFFLRGSHGSLHCLGIDYINKDVEKLTTANSHAPRRGGYTIPIWAREFLLHYCRRNSTCIKARRFNVYNIYAPLYHSNTTTVIPKNISLTHFDPCNNFYVHHYLNLAEVQLAFHATFTSWVLCRNAKEVYDTGDVLNKTTLPLLPNIMANGVPILVFSGDFDSVVSFMSTKNVLKKLNLTEVVQWSPWKSNDEVVGHRIVYEGGLTFTIIRGAGHMVPSYKPKQALRMIQHFLKGQGINF